MVEAEEVDAAIKKLTPVQRRALSVRQFAMFDRDMIVARGGTITALRRRGIVAGSAASNHLTELGEAVVARIEVA